MKKNNFYISVKNLEKIKNIIKMIPKGNFQDGAETFDYLAFEAVYKFLLTNLNFVKTDVFRNILINQGIDYEITEEKINSEQGWISANSEMQKLKIKISRFITSKSNGTLNTTFFEYIEGQGYVPIFDKNQMNYIKFHFPNLLLIYTQAESFRKKFYMQKENNLNLVKRKAVEVIDLSSFDEKQSKKLQAQEVLMFDVLEKLEAQGWMKNNRSKQIQELGQRLGKQFKEQKEQKIEPMLEEQTQPDEIETQQQNIFK